jgi:hypothetical protein
LRKTKRRRRRSKRRRRRRRRRRKTKAIIDASRRCLHSPRFQTSAPCPQVCMLGSYTAAHLQLYFSPSS